MRNLKVCLLMFFGLLASLCVNAQDDVVNDYKVDFNTPITTNSNAHGAENRDFLISLGWGHMVGVENIGYGNVPTYVPYTYNTTGGIDNTGCLQAGAGAVYDSYAEDYVNIWDFLVTPLVKGTVTIKMKKVVTNGFIEFYTMQKNGDKWEKGILLDAKSLMLPNTNDFVTYTLPELKNYTYIGIRMVYCYVDDFTATTANFKKMASLKVNDVMPNTDQLIDADAEGKFKVTFTTTVTNNGDFDFAKGTENYSVSLYKYNAGGGADKADHVHIVTVPVDEDLAMKATSGELTLTATLDKDDYPAAETNGISFRIYENISGTYKSTKNVKVVPYVPIIKLQTKTGNSTKNIFEWRRDVSRCIFVCIDTGCHGSERWRRTAGNTERDRAGRLYNNTDGTEHRTAQKCEIQHRHHGNCRNERGRLVDKEQCRRLHAQTESGNCRDRQVFRRF